jgi:hypothetical protein
LNPNASLSKSCQLHVSLPWNMFRNVYICCWMFWCIAGTIRMSFGSKTGNFVPQTRRATLLAKSTLIAKFFRMNHAISEIYANSEIDRMSHAPGALLAQPSGPANMLHGCWLSVGPWCIPMFFFQRFTTL